MGNMGCGNGRGSPQDQKRDHKVKKNHFWVYSLPPCCWYALCTKLCCIVKARQQNVKYAIVAFVALWKPDNRMWNMHFKGRGVYHHCSCSTDLKKHRCAKHMGRGEYIADVTITPRILARYVTAGPITPGDTSRQWALLMALLMSRFRGTPHTQPTMVISIKIPLLKCLPGNFHIIWKLMEELWKKKFYRYPPSIWITSSNF